MWKTIVACCLAVACAACRGPRRSVPEVLDVHLTRGDDGTYSLSVTVRHDDEGWDHYADRWVVEGAGGEEIARRVLRHPHVEEQPCTRSLAGVRVPAGTTRLAVRAHCSTHGYGPPFEISLAE
jgi:hypothetical protein